MFWFCYTKVNLSFEHLIVTKKAKNQKLLLDLSVEQESLSSNCFS